MKRLQCEMCGSQDLIKEGGVFICQACGTKYSVEEAKKMMVEGSVSVDGTVSVKGTVKVDKSDELENLYVLARRAKDSDNTENACRYYREIEVKDPNSWEAYFYLIYFKARTAKIGEIDKECKNIANSIPTMLNLLQGQITSVQEQTSALKTIERDITNIAHIMMSSAMSLGFPDNVHYTATILDMMEKTGDYIYDKGEAYYENANSIWKSAVLTYVDEFCLGKPVKDNYRFSYKRGVSKV